MNQFTQLGFIGGLELVVILVVMLFWIIVVGAIIALIVFLIRRNDSKSKTSAPPSLSATATIRSPSHCPHCGKPLTAASVQGICPECLLQAGLGTQGPDAAETKFTPPALDQLAPLFPQLELLELLGRGGMGAVYKARQRELNRLVALKVLPADKAERDPAFAERFAREARALAALNHPNIVTVFDHGQAGGHCWLLMEYVDGLSLRQLLQRGSMKPEEAIAIVPRICEALQFAHQHGIVHRDIKPENILVDTLGRVKIADFGIAKIAGPESERANLTEPQQTIGTPHYMAPEQVEKPSTVDHRADIYSLGVVFYEMLTGELPLGKFASPSQKVQVDVRLDEIVLRALEKEPARRYQQAGEVKTAVETIGSLQAPRSFRPQTVGLRQALRESSWPAMKWGLGVLALILGLGVAVTLVTPKTYQATVRLIFPGSDAPRLDDPFDLQTLHEKIKHPEIISNVVAKLDLQNRWSDRFGSGFNGMKTFGYLQASLQIRRSRDSSNLPSIDLMVFSESPNEAAEIAEAIAEAFATTAPWRRPTTAWNPAQTEQLRPNLWLNVGLAFVLGTFIGAVVAAGYVVARAARRTHQASVDSGAQFAGSPLSTDALNYRSKATLFGMPLLHLTDGIDPETRRPNVARGIIALGPVAKGVVAIGGRSVGVVACGGLATGVFAFGGCAFGLVTLGGMSVALGLAMGGLAIAPIALGGGAVGLYAMGGGAYGLHAFGGNIQDPVAKAFFVPWGFQLISKIGGITVGLLLLMLPFILLPTFLRRRRAGS